MTARAAGFNTIHSSPAAGKSETPGSFSELVLVATNDSPNEAGELDARVVVSSEPHRPETSRLNGEIDQMVAPLVAQLADKRTRANGHALFRWSYSQTTDGTTPNLQTGPPAAAAVSPHPPKCPPSGGGGIAPPPKSPPAAAVSPHPPKSPQQRRRYAPPPKSPGNDAGSSNRPHGDAAGETSAGMKPQRKFCQPIICKPEQAIPQPEDLSRTVIPITARAANTTTEQQATCIGRSYS